MADNYWKERELKHIEQSIKDDAKISRRLRRLQLEAMEEIEQQIDAFYGRYATKEGISMQEARKRVSKLDIEKYERKAKRYVRNKNFSERANEEMRLYNVTMSINRLELLKANIHLELLAMTSQEQRILFETMTASARAEYERQSGILGQSINYNEKNIQAIVNASFLNATWSDRLWDNQDALRSELDRLLNRGMVQGLNPRVLARELRKTFDTSVYNSERLLVTELGRVQIQVQEDSFKQAEIEEYEYIAQIDNRTSKTCRSLDGEIFKVKDMQPGTNAPPMHPWCRSSIAAFVSRESFEKDLEIRGL